MPVSIEYLLPQAKTTALFVLASDFPTPIEIL